MTLAVASPRDSSNGHPDNECFKRDEIIHFKRDRIIHSKLDLINFCSSEDSADGDGDSWDEGPWDEGPWGGGPWDGGPWDGVPLNQALGFYFYL